MAATNINRVVISGNLTRDVELRATQSGMNIASLRIASNTRRKVGDEWADHANYFDVTVFGAQGENVAKFLSRGSGVMIDGRLEYREWEATDGTKRNAVQIIADSVQFVGGRDDSPADTAPPAEDDTPEAPSTKIPF